MLERRSFVQGALLLAGATMLSKILGSIYTIVLQNVIGDHGMGLFQMAYPVYSTLLAVATAGFPVAISKLVSEELAIGDYQSAKQVLNLSAIFLSLAGIACFAVLFFGAPMWAQWAGDPSATMAIRAISPALLFVPMLSALRGYFQGYQWMEPTAFSQVMEQLIRVVTIIGLAIWLTHRGFPASVSAAGAAFGAVTGAMAGLVAIAYYWKKKPHLQMEMRQRTHRTKYLLGRLLYYAFPISLGALVVPLMNNVDVMTVVNLLKSAGENQHLATTEFGLLSGRAAKLMMLPTTLAAGIGIAVMPALSEAFTLGYRRLVSNRIDLSIRMTVLLALPSMIGLMVVARPINFALFHNGDGTRTIQILALAILFASAQTTLAAILQGGGWVYLPVLNLLLACTVKLFANLWLVPRYGIDGAAWATDLSYFVAASLNVWAMSKKMKEKLHWGRWLLKPMIATFILFATVFSLEKQWIALGGMDLGRLFAALATLVIIGIGMLVYLFALLASGCLTADEVLSMPKVGPKLVLWFSKLGLLK